MTELSRNVNDVERGEILVTTLISLTCKLFPPPPPPPPSASRKPRTKLVSNNPTSESTIEEPEDQRLRLLEEKLGKSLWPLSSPLCSILTHFVILTSPTHQTAHLEFTLLHAPSPHSPTLPSYQISSPDPFPSILSAIQGSGDEISTKDEIQNFLQKELINRQRISASRDVDWMLARGGMAKELTVHLVYGLPSLPSLSLSARDLTSNPFLSINGRLLFPTPRFLSSKTQNKTPTGIRPAITPRPIVSSSFFSSLPPSFPSGV